MLVSPPFQFISLFGLNIYCYGLILAFSILIGFLLADKIAKKFYNIHIILDQAFFIILAGIIGARLYYCILNYKIYLEMPIRIFNLREGGLSIHGAIIGGIISLLILAKRFNLKFLHLSDIFAIILPLSQSIGRWGNYFNSEAFGLPTNNFFKLYVAPSFRPLGYENYNYFHPTFLYESIFDLLLFILLYKFVLKRYYKQTGFISGVYLVGYSLIRLLIEPLRLDCTAFVFNIPIPILASVIMVIIGLFLMRKGLSSK